MTYEKFLEETGGCGTFQLLLTIIITIPRLVIRWDIFMMAFGGYDPGWRCINNSTQISNNITGTYNDTCVIRHICSKIEFNPKASTIVTEWGLVCDREWIVSFIIYIQMVGSLIGSVVAGHCSEQFGRKPVLYSAMTFFSILSVCLICCVSWEMFTVFWFCTNICVGASQSTAYLFTTEFLNSKWRGVVAAIPANGLSMCLLAGITWLEKGWRYLQLTNAAVSSLVLLSVFWIPESIRWLIAHKKEKELKKVLNKIVKVNRKTTPSTDYYEVLSEEITEESSSKRYTYLDLLKNRDLRWTMIKLVPCWILPDISFYALSFGLKALSGNFYFNLFITSVAEVPFSLVVGCVINHFGRRVGAIGFISIPCVLCVLVAIVSAGAEVSEEFQGVTITVLVALVRSVLAGGNDSVELLTMEMSPTVVRPLVCSFLTLAANIGVLTTPLFIPHSRETFPYVFSVLAGFLFLATLIVYTLPETNGMVLSDNLKGETSSDVDSGDSLQTDERLENQCLFSE